MRGKKAMKMLRPTCALTFRLSGPAANADTARAIKRSFSYVAPTRVLPASTPTDGAYAESAIRLEVRLPAGMSLEAATAQGEDSAWRTVVRPWLSNKLGKLMGTVRECNNPERPSYFGEVGYKRLEIAIGARTFAFDLALTDNPEAIVSGIERALVETPR